MADEAERAEGSLPQHSPSPSGSAQASPSANPRSASGRAGHGRGRSTPQLSSSGPVPLDLTDLSQHQTFTQRPSLRRAPTARNR